jgi:hypothetical protein
VFVGAVGVDAVVVLVVIVVMLLWMGLMLVKGKPSFVC